MGTMLAALLHLQTIERQLAQVRSRLNTRKNAVAVQQRRIDQLRQDWKALHDKSTTRRVQADRLELDLKIKEQQVAKLRTSLNTAKTNKEYAAILTQINTYKADNAKVEEEVLKIMQDVEGVKAQADQVQEKINQEEKRLAEVQKTSQDEINRLSALVADLTAKRTEAAKSVPPEALATFERVADSNEGEGMAVIEVHGKKPPFEYVCGGCFMSLNAEHANALRVKDQVRTCDNCRRILYMEPEAQASRSK